MSDSEVIIGTILTVVVAGILGGPGVMLLIMGRPRRFRFPTCGLCRADVTEWIAEGACRACKRSFAETGVLPPRIFFQPIMLIFGTLLSLAAVGFLVFVFLETFYM
jgi:hypothetical protein